MCKLLTATVTGLMFLSLSMNACADAMLLGDAARGKKLHDANCVSCHQQRYGGNGSGMYTRKDRKIATIEGLIGQVNGCNKNVNANFSNDDVNDVVNYLNTTYYKF